MLNMLCSIKFGHRPI